MVFNYSVKEHCHARLKKQLEYIENTQTLIGSKRRNIMDVDTGEMMTVDQITKRVYGTKNFGSAT